MPDLCSLDRRGLVAGEVDWLAISARLQITVRGNIDGIELRELEALQQLPFVVK
ncbi:hypothetical protein D9M70_628050 [compost metagenome]